MAKCPKCNHKLRITDISQFCPECGVNMRFCNFEENFIREAKIAELSQATVHVKIKRLKAAFIGTKLCIVRLCVVLLPILALLIPAGSFSVSLPYVSFKADLGAIGLYAMFTNGSFGYMNQMCSSSLLGAQFSAVRLAVFSYVAIAAFAVFVLLSTILCFISYKNMQKVIAGIALAGSAVSIVNAILTISATSKFAQASGGFGAWVAALMFIVVAAVNIILVKKGIPVEYAEGMLERVEYWHKYKSGEINIDDLPQPVVETEETRKIDAEIAAEEESFRKKQESDKKNAEKGESES